ncbi:class I SAM-dependent methyltransferase [Xanthomonas citri pv. glycines]|uniref:FkbM family methyltransferase n=5 Tax=Xanthomonas TaxID=338 RepID=A0AB33CJK1_XANCI|nr:MULTISPECIES: hypothetical protein [Xanthomonas]MBV6783540.1 class I SAM-dependent methyltransferase [Xanthomonas campestris pv. trichodesmae]ARV24656.1 FkbM family methyltransferase [Xanthomonas citri pv. glycines str. 12-2]ASK90937.1 FkbM family methyltransferase [Xanthomonas citri pv. vignicola]EKQ61808.1 FkbM family methyltransferase [Xanthomonas citri pv. malvacearum str. GSPB2388]MBZ3921003.1 FkbM family methyltransferase [Xanthomonas campestris pv. trichodesmae]
MKEVTDEAVTWAYRFILGREPENQDVIKQVSATLPSINELRLNLLRSREFAQDQSHRYRSDQSPFFHYAATFDAIGVMQNHAVPDLEPRVGVLTNFLGVAIDPKFFPSVLSERGGEVEGIPIPANWHADIAEWGAALRAVDLSQGSFTVIELGCGWGCWLNNTGVAARALGRDVRVIGIEADAHHLQFAEEALTMNGFLPEQISLMRGIAASRAGTALFPKQDLPGASWGNEPIFDASEQQCETLLSGGMFDRVTMVPLEALIGDQPRIDLLHIDIQGGEADLVEQSLDLLGRSVAYMVIGTHSKQIEGRLYDALLQAGWALEMERAAIFTLIAGKPEIRVDGVQGWRNLKLLPF